MIKKLKNISRFLNLSSIKKTVTCHFFGLLHYSAAVWLDELTTSSQWRTLNSLHYRALRVCSKDYFDRIHNTEIDKMFERAMPHEWMCYTCANTSVNLYFQGELGPLLMQKLTTQAYINDRNPGVVLVIDTSRLRFGRHAFINRLQWLEWKNVTGREEFQSKELISRRHFLHTSGCGLNNNNLVQYRLIRC